jgi:uncharacterized repeat protein (TIGR02543 family)
MCRTGTPDCTSGTGNTCSLRDALTLAAPGGTDIAFASGVIGSINLSSTLPTITGNLDLVGPGANILTVSGGGSSVVGTIFTVFSSNAAISGITIANGNNTSQNGGGIVNFGGTLTVNNSTFSGNSSAAAAGGILNDGGTATVNNSVLAGDTGGECSGNGGGCPSNGTNGDVVIATPAQPILAPLGWYGGPIQTMLPLLGSTAVCAGSVALIPGGVTTDQRGFARLNLTNSNCVDAGAVQTNYLIVTTTTDQVDGSPDCTSGHGSTCSLRDAVTLANSNGSADIAFASTVTGTITLISTLPTITGNLDLVGPGAANLTISGGNSPSVGGMFNVASLNVAISGITVANGHNVGSGNGGGIFNGGGTLTVSNSAFSANTADGFGGAIFNDQGTLMVINSTLSGGNNSGGGGAIFNGGILAVTNCTISGNTANAGGGIYMSAGTVTVTNSTLTGDVAAGNGGGINNSGGTLTVNNSTISGNTAHGMGGGITNIEAVTLSNSIVAGNTSQNTPGDDCDNCGPQSSSNLINTISNIPPINPLLAPLGSYGGPMQTMLPLPGSPAICAGSAALDPAGLLTDQRGFPRLNITYTGYSATTPCLDLGAVQTNYQSIQFAQSTYSGLPNQDITSPANPVVSVTENGQNIGAVPVTLSFSETAPSSVSGTGPVTTVAGTGATFSALTVSPGGNYTLLASLAITSSVTISNTAALNIDTPATVTSVTTTSPSGTYTTGAVIYVSVNFSKAVTVTGTPTLALNSGATVNYSSGSSSSSLVFKYTVASPQSTAGLDVSSSSALSGTIQDSSSVAANLTLPTGNATGIVINTTQYTLTIAASPSADGTVKATPTSTQNVTPTLSPGTYLSGTQVTLSATASSTLYKFSNWTGTTASTSTPLMITMTKSFSETANFVPNTVGVTIATSPSGLSFSVDGTTYTSTQTLTWTVGSKHTIATTTPQRVTGISYENPTWSDGGAISHTVTASVGTTSYTATFEVYYALTTVASPSAGGTVTPSLGGFFPAGSVVSIQASPKSGYTFKNWTGPVANATEASTTVTMTAPETVTANFAKK